MRSHGVALAQMHPKLVARTRAKLDVSVEVIHRANVDGATASISRGGQEGWVAIDEV